MSIIGIMRDIAHKESQRIYSNELGVVTAVFSHSVESDRDNYECSVALKDRLQPDGNPLELSRVPVATPHVGLVNSPRVGELVLLAFVGGDVNAPIIIGRLYHDQQRPPVSQPGELMLENLQRVRIKVAGATIEIDEQGTVHIDGAQDVIVNGGTRGAARIDDEVAIELAPGALGQVPLPAPYLVPPAATTLTGTIVSASETVKIGD